MVTKQQQLEWLANKITKWPDDRTIGYMMSRDEAGFVVGLFTRVSSYDPLTGYFHVITHEEWKQERDKMSSKPEVDSSWHERGDKPPVGVVCEVLNNELYNPAWEKCTIIFMGEYKCIYSSESCSERVGNVDLTGAIEFRPLRTEREKVIDEMMSLVMDGLMSHEMAKELAIKMHDAGYRKVSQ